MQDKPLTEAEIRAMRDIVFGHTSGDFNWSICRGNWMKPEGIAWLKSQLK